MLRSLLDGPALTRVRHACVEIFELRATHPWPATVTVFDAWRDSFPREADALGFEIRDVHEAAAAVQAFVDEIHRAEGA